jgi:hypothetical protein
MKWNPRRSRQRLKLKSHIHQVQNPQCPLPTLYLYVHLHASPDDHLHGVAVWGGINTLGIEMSMAREQIPTQAIPHAAGNLLKRAETHLGSAPRGHRSTAPIRGNRADPATFIKGQR